MAQCTYIQNPPEISEGHRANHFGLFPFSVLPSAYFLCSLYIKGTTWTQLSQSLTYFLLILMNFLLFWQDHCNFYAFYFAQFIFKAN